MAFIVHWIVPLHPRVIHPIDLFACDPLQHLDVVRASQRHHQKLIQGVCVTASFAALNTYTLSRPRRRAATIECR